MKFRNKILLAIWGVVLVMLLMTSIIINYAVRIQVQSRFEDELRRDYTIITEINSLRTSQDIKSSEIIAESPRIKAVAELGDKNTALQLSHELSQNLLSDIFILTDGKGNELAALRSGQPVNIPESQIPSVRHALGREPYADMWSTDTTVYRIVSVPITVGADLVGTLTIGFKLRSEDIPLIKYMTNSDVLLAIDTSIVASTFSIANKQDLHTYLESSIQSAQPFNKPNIFTFKSGSDSYVAMFYRLDHENDPARKPISYLLIRSIDRDVQAALIPLLKALFLFSIIVLALTAVIGYFISGSITKPIASLIKGTTEISDGNYDYRMNLKTGGELKLLAENFEEMSIALKEKIHLLAERNRDVEETLRKLKETQKERFELATNLQLILESTGEGIYGMDNGGNCTFCNPACCHLLGYESPSALLSKNMHELIHHKKSDGSFYPVEECPVSRTLTKGEKHHLDTEVYWKADGSSFPVEYWSYPIYQDKLLVGTVVTFLDVTQKKALESQLMRTQRLESIGTLAGGIAHDLNNVLAPLMMAVQVMKKHITDESMVRMLTTLETSAKRGADIVRQVLTFARGVDGERIVLQPKHVLREIENIIKETFPRSIRLSCDLPGDLYNIHADATQFHQVILNLCVNARDAMPGGGTLSIKAENTTLETENLKLYSGLKPGPYVLITIGDTGTGIPPEILDKIYDPFFTTKEIGKGTGLGLSIALGIVRKHDGLMTVYSEVNRGTQFKIYLPQAKSEAGGARQASREELPQGHGEMILVVDDETSICEITKATLETYGYRVCTANDGTEAMGIFVKFRKDIRVVLTDMMMPIMDGPTTVRALRKIDPSIKIIATSGMDNSNEFFKATGNEIQVFLQKPYTTEKLLRTLHTVLNQT